MIKIKNILWLLPFFCFFAGYVTPRFFIRTTTHIITPTLIGKSCQAALQLASKEQLSIRLIQLQQDPAFAPFTVLTQNPLPGKTIRPHQTISITAAAQPAVKIAPCCLQETQQAATSLLEAKGINYNIIPIPSKAPANSIINQLPKPGNNMIKKMQLFTAAHQEQLVIIPSFKGHPINLIENTIALHKIPFTLHHECKLPTPLCICRVYDQKPSAGSIISLEKPPILYLSARC